LVLQRIHLLLIPDYTLKGKRRKDGACSAAFKPSRVWASLETGS
jgi:hypothetical protein